jgi:hypothetical protein
MQSVETFRFRLLRDEELEAGKPAPASLEEGFRGTTGTGDAFPQSGKAFSKQVFVLIFYA